MPKIAVIANPKSGGGYAWDTCKTLIQERPDQFEFFQLGDSSLEEVIMRAWQKGCTTVVAAGGDGTVSSVASVLVRRKIPMRLAILPIGTFNHFAQDLKIPPDVSKALDVAQNGRTILIDMGKVNDLYFINNVGVGVYPHIVHARSDLEKRGWSKWIAFCIVAIPVLIRQFSFTISFLTNNTSIQKRVSGVFIGNNAYQLKGLDVGARPKLDDGILFAAFFGSIGIFDLPRLVYKVFMGTVLSEHHIDVIGLHECTIASRTKKIYITHDGEISSMRTPLRFSTESKVLRCVVPV